MVNNHNDISCSANEEGTGKYVTRQELKGVQAGLNLIIKFKRKALLSF